MFIAQENGLKLGLRQESNVLVVEHVAPSERIVLLCTGYKHLAALRPERAIRASEQSGHYYLIRIIAWLHACLLSDSLFGSPDPGSRDKELPPAESQPKSTRVDKPTSGR